MSPESVLAARGRSVVKIGAGRWLVDAVRSYDAAGLAALAARGAR